MLKIGLIYTVPQKTSLDGPSVLRVSDLRAIIPSHFQHFNEYICVFNQSLNCNHVQIIKCTERDVPRIVSDNLGSVAI